MYNVISTWKEEKHKTELTRLSRRAFKCPHCEGLIVVELHAEEIISLSETGVRHTKRLKGAVEDDD